MFIWFQDKIPDRQRPPLLPPNWNASTHRNTTGSRVSSCLFHVFFHMNKIFQFPLGFKDLVSGMWNEPYLLNTVDGRNSAPVGRWFIHVYPTTISLIIYSVS